LPTAVFWYLCELFSKWPLWNRPRNANQVRCWI